MLSTLCFQPTQLKNVQAQSIDTNGNKPYEETTKVNLKGFNLSLVNGEPKVSKKSNALLGSTNGISDDKNVSNFNELMKNKNIKESVIQSIKQGRKPVAIAAKSVYVGKDERLLTTNEVTKYGQQPIGRHAYQSKWKFTLSLNVSVSAAGVYWLQAGGTWNVRSGFMVNSSNGPGVGDDFIGLHWGDNYCNMSNPSATGSYEDGDTFTPYSTTPTEIHGQAWGFRDLVRTSLSTTLFDIPATRVYGGVGIKTVGTPGYTGFTASYVHTWSDINYVPSFGASPTGITGSLSVQPSSSSWPLAVSVSGYY